MHRSFRIRWLLATMALAGGTAAAKPIDLAPKFIPGITLHYTTEGLTKLHMRVELLDLDEVHVVRKQTGMSLTTVAVDSNGTAEVDWVLHYVAIESDGAVPGIAEKLDYDSRKSQAAPSPLAPLFAPLLEKPITVRFDAKGRVQAVDGLPSDPAVGLLENLTRDFLSPEAFAALPMFITASAPRPTKVRSKWEQTIPVAMPLGAGAVDLKQTFTFKRMSPRRRTAQIAMKGQAAPGPIAGQLVEVRQSEARGAFTWDYATGSLLEAETQLELDTAFNSVLGPMELTQSLSTVVRRTQETEEAPRRSKRAGESRRAREP